MAFDFPASPTVGQEYNAGPLIYVWSGYGWAIKAMGEAPNDGRFYARKNYVWADISPMAIGFPFVGKPAASGMTIIPMAIPVTIAASLAGAMGYAMTAATASATFTLNKITAAGVSSAVGTIVTPAGVKSGFTLSGAGASLVAGDVLQMIAPSTQDTTLSDVGITILATRA